MTRIRSGGSSGTSSGGGSAGPAGPPGPVEGVPLFIQDAAPTTTAPKYFWIESNAVGTQAKLWIEDGA